MSDVRVLRGKARRAARLTAAKVLKKTHSWLEAPAWIAERNTAQSVDAAFNAEWDRIVKLLEK